MLSSLSSYTWQSAVNCQTIDLLIYWLIDGLIKLIVSNSMAQTKTAPA